MRKAASHRITVKKDTKKESTFLRTLLLSLAVIVSFTMSTRQAYAIDFSQAANSLCDPATGQVAIWVRFTNAEPLNSGRSVDVVGTDEQSGASVSFGTIIAKDTVDKVIYTNVYTNQNGRIRFDVSGVAGTAVEYATYSGKVCQAVASATPVATVSPTASPSATPNGGSCNCGGTVTPSPTPVPTVTATPVPVSNMTNPPSDNRSDNLGCSVRDCSGNVVPRGGAQVLGSTSGTPQTLPSTGSNGNVFILYTGIAVAVLALGLGLRRYARLLESA